MSLEHATVNFTSEEEMKELSGQCIEPGHKYSDTVSVVNQVFPLTVSR